MRSSPQIRLGGKVHGQEGLKIAFGPAGLLCRLRIYHGVDCLHDVPAATVIRRNSQMQARIRSGSRLCRNDEFLQALFETREVADDTQADPVAVQLVDFLLERLDEEL